MIQKDKPRYDLSRSMAATAIHHGTAAIIGLVGLRVVHESKLQNNTASVKKRTVAYVD